MAVAIVAEGGLAFLGLSRRATHPDVGRHDQRRSRRPGRLPRSSASIPCAVMFVTVLALNLAGDRLREYFDIKEGAL